jgi:hypothetical protein
VDQILTVKLHLEVVVLELLVETLVPAQLVDQVV